VPSLRPAAPPYGLVTPLAPCRALTALAARATPGGQRESLLACLTGARLALGLLPPLLLAEDVRRARAAAAHAWLGALGLPAAQAGAAARLFEATTGPATQGAAGALRALATAVSAALNTAAAAELEALARLLDPSARADHPAAAEQP
jgi:hypothetical protein